MLWGASPLQSNGEQDLGMLDLTRDLQSPVRPNSELGRNPTTRIGFSFLARLWLAWVAPPWVWLARLRPNSELGRTFTARIAGGLLARLWLDWLASLWNCFVGPRPDFELGRATTVSPVAIDFYKRYALETEKMAPRHRPSHPLCQTGCNLNKT